MNESKTREFARKRAIRRQIQSILLGKTKAQDRVFINRSIPTQEEDLPVILIYSTNEAITRMNEAPKDYKREMNIRIECVAVGDQDEDLDGRLEEIGDVVENLMEQDETLGDLVHYVELKGTEYTAEAEAQSPVGVLALTYTLIFFTDALTEKSLDNFSGTDVTYDLGDSNKPKPTDTVNVET